LEKKFFCIDLSEYRLITIFWNSLPTIFKLGLQSITSYHSVFGYTSDEASLWLSGPVHSPGGSMWCLSSYD